MNINTFFFKDNGDSLSLFFFRVSLGTFLLMHFLSIITDFDLFYSSNGIIPTDVQTLYNEKYFISLSSISVYLNIEERLFLILFKAAYVLFCLSLIFGLLTRFSAFILILLHLTIVKGTSFYSYGVDFFASIALSYSFFFPLGKTRSIDAKIFKKQEVNFTPYRRILQIHMSIIYFVSGFDKIVGNNWRNGEAIWKSIHLPFFNLEAQDCFNFLSDFPVIFFILGWCVILIELCYPIFIWIDKTRRLWLVAVVCLHIGIAFGLNLYFFSAIMILLNISAFYNFKDKRKVVIGRIDKF